MYQVFLDLILILYECIYPILLLQIQFDTRLVFFFFLFFFQAKYNWIKFRFFLLLDQLPYQS